ncbi:MAG TPA: hypothetical protein VJT15_12280 [Pyrinomonadaceae bacterium]|nr:hypothetical protein [Pyrinomonadaceae bacterium]
MKSTILVIVIVASFIPVSGQQNVSRFGLIEIKDNDEGRHKLLLNGKEIFQYEGQSIEIARVLNGSARDYLIAGNYSGGIACPVQFVIVEIYKSGGHKVSEKFGTCTDLFKVRLVNDRVIVEMRQYTAHPDVFPKKELRERDRTKVVYTWYKGKLSEKEVAR